MKTNAVDRLCLFASLLLSAFQPASSIAAEASPLPPDSCLVYTGSYCKAPAEGIQVFRLNHLTGELTKIGGAAGVTNPSFLALHPSQKFLYAVCETDEFSGRPMGAVAAFALDGLGVPKLLNMQPSGGQGPCHLSLDPAGRNVLIANYVSGQVAVASIGDDGQLSPPSCVVQHTGQSVHPQRQTGPHAHSINLDPAGKFAFAADLGIDKIMVYKFGGADGQLTPNDPPATAVPAGSGPRHFAFHPSGKFAYANGELTSTVLVFAYDSERGVLMLKQELSTLPHKVEGNTTAETLVSPAGRHVYVSNRGHNSLAVFSVDEATGQLTAVGHCPTGGKIPRNFGIDPSGEWLLAANQESGNVMVFKLDAESGMPTPAGHEVSLPSAVCVKFLVK